MEFETYAGGAVSCCVLIKCKIASELFPRAVLIVLFLSWRRGLTRLFVSILGPLAGDPEAFSVKYYLIEYVVEHN